MRLLLLLLLAGCLDEEDDCEPGMVEIDVQALDPLPSQWWVGATAVGGIQHVSAHTYDVCGTRQPSSQVTATTSSPSLISATVVASEEIELHAYQAGTTELEVQNQRGLHVRRPIDARPIAAVQLGAREEGQPQVFYPGRTARIDLLDAGGKNLVDRGLTVVGDTPRAAAWNELDLANAPVGDHALEIIAGTSTWPVTLSVVDGIDTVVAEHDTITVTEYLASADVCFFAERAGQMVAGVPWTFTVAGGEHDPMPYIPNCITVWSDNAEPITVTATALGLTAVSHVVVSSM